MTLAEQITKTQEELGQLTTGGQTFRIEKALVLVNQIGVMLLLFGNRNYSDALNQETERNQKLTVDFAGTFNGWKIYLITGVQVAVGIFAAASGVGFLGSTLQGASTVIGQTIQIPGAVSKIFEESGQAQRTLLDGDREIIRSSRNDLADNRSKNIQQINGEIGNIKELERALHEAISQINR